MWSTQKALDMLANKNLCIKGGRGNDEMKICPLFHDLKVSDKMQKGCHSDEDMHALVGQNVPPS